MKCPTCDGLGKFPSQLDICPVCKGQGHLPDTRRNNQECVSCEGRGKFPSSLDVCPVCQGWGRLTSEAGQEASLVKLGSPTADYVDQGRLNELRAISSSDFDLSKLVRLLEELISCRRQRNYYAIMMLCRAIIDHVPPIFRMKNFNEVANNYGPKSFKESMERLNNCSRKIADQHLHTPIRSRETLPTITQVDFSNDLDVLLSEIVRILRK
jgi:hypothetical protein